MTWWMVSVLTLANSRQKCRKSGTKESEMQKKWYQKIALVERSRMSCKSSPGYQYLPGAVGRGCGLLGLAVALGATTDNLPVEA
jgi:hypothetical protein